MSNPSAFTLFLYCELERTKHRLKFLLCILFGKGLLDLNLLICVVFLKVFLSTDLKNRGLNCLLNEPFYAEMKLDLKGFFFVLFF